jgi:hypothetical protein
MSSLLPQTGHAIGAPCFSDLDESAPEPASAGPIRMLPSAPPSAMLERQKGAGHTTKRPICQLGEASHQRFSSPL